MSDLLRRYPNISDQERRELADFLKRGHPDEWALVAYGNGLEPQVVAFKKEHPEHFRTGLRVMLPWLVLVLGLALPLLLTWQLM